MPRRGRDGAKLGERHEQLGVRLRAGLPRRAPGGAARGMAGAGPRRVGRRAGRDHRDDPRGGGGAAGGHPAFRAGRRDADQGHHPIGQGQVNRSLPASGCVTPQPPGRTPRSAGLRASGTTQPQAPLRCPGGEDTPPEASEAPARGAMSGWRALLADRGSSAVELAVLAPALMMICMLILQFGLWFNARQTALAAAQAGAVVARQEAASKPGGWRADAERTARQYYQRLNSRLLKQVNATTATAAPGNVYVTVSGQVAVSVFPFFGLHLTVSATAGGPVECFRPAGQGGAC